MNTGINEQWAQHELTKKSKPQIDIPKVPKDATIPNIEDEIAESIIDSQKDEIIELQKKVIVALEEKIKYLEVQLRGIRSIKRGTKGAQMEKT